MNEIESIKCTVLIWVNFIQIQTVFQNPAADITESGFIMPIEDRSEYYLSNFVSVHDQDLSTNSFHEKSESQRSSLENRTGHPNSGRFQGMNWQIYQPYSN